MSALASLTRPQKAAAILVAMGKPAASKLLKFFKQDELKALIEGARLLRTIPQADLEKIVSEFEAEFTEGAGLLDSADKMDTILNESLSREEVDAIMGENQPIATDNGPPPVWPQLETMEPDRIGAFLSSEHAQTAALVMSKLAPQTAANVLVTLEKTVRRDVIARMVSMTSVTDEAVRIVEDQIRTSILAESSTRDTSAGQIRVASLLNEMDKTQLDDIMRDLEESGTPDLQAIKSRLFSFEDVTLLTQKARVLLFDGLSTEVVTLALRGAPADMTEAILSSIGARSRRMIESELSQGAEGVPQAEIGKARKAIASAAVRLSREGAFELPSMQTEAQAA